MVKVETSGGTQCCSLKQSKFFTLANFDRKSADLLVGMVNFNSSKQLVYKTEYFLMKLINIDDKY